MTTARQMLPVYALALSAFVFNTSEFVPVALLSDIGADFSMKNEQVGLMMTIYAWLVAILSLPIMLATANIERKKLLTAIFILFIIAHAIAFFATNFTILLISRILVAICHACFWSITSSLVVRVAPDGQGSKALGFLATGGAVAMILGLPLGRIIGQLSDWRMAFLGIGIVAIGIVITLQKTLPHLPATQTGNLASLPTIIKNKPLIARYALILLIVTAHFTAYSYIEPFMLNIGFSENSTTLALLLFGVAGIVSSFIFGKFFDNWQQRLMWSAFIIMTTGLSLLWWAGNMLVIWLIIAFLWGGCANLLGLSLQMQVLKMANNDQDVAMSLFSAIFNVGIGAGAMIGGMVLANMGLINIGIAGATIMLLAISIFWVTTKSFKL